MNEEEAECAEETSWNGGIMGLGIHFFPHYSNIPLFLF
jgi:hypothetical protein